MRRKLVAVWISLALLFGFFVIVDVFTDITPTVNAATLYVNQTGSGGAFTSIQDAVDAANNGDTVYVYEGTYIESVVVNKTINLTGENKESTIINVFVFSYVIKIVSNWVNVSGFTVIGSGPSSGDDGIELYNVFYCHIYNNIALMNSEGIHITSSSYNNNITGNNVSNNGDGIRLSGSGGNNIMNNNVSYSDRDGIHLSSSNWNNLTGNNISNNKNGIWLRNSNNNSMIDNILTSINERGIFICDSSNNFLTGNIMINNGILIDESGQFNHWDTHNIDISNTVNGKPVYYWKNQVGGAIPSDAGQVILANCTNVKINGLNLTNSSVGVQLGFSSSNDIIGNNISSNNLKGIQLYKSNRNNIVNNYVFSNSIFFGIRLRLSDENNITSNLVLFSFIGIFYSYSDYNLMTNNTIFSNDIGIFARNSYNNSIYHNNLIDNLNQAIDETNNGNKWDDGYPSGGNFWSDYNGVDLNGTPSQDVPPPDGIGDTPYIIDSDSQDNYPLMDLISNRTFLYEGWNLISIPFIQPDTNLGIVLDSIKGSYDAVQWYNISDSSDHWKHNHISKQSHLNDLNSIDHTISFWIHITEPGGVLFEYSGIQPIVNQSIPLHPGWNLVGYPSLNNKDRTTALNNINFPNDVDAIWAFNSVTQRWEEISPTDYFELGRGYWIHSKVEKTWEVPL
jgi:parallel beta-helix repeat protein